MNTFQIIDTAFYLIGGFAIGTMCGHFSKSIRQSARRAFLCGIVWVVICSIISLSA